MILTESEKRLLLKLKIKNEKWKIHKWINIFNATVILSIFFVNFRDELILLALGIYLLVDTVSNWNGRPESMLLLKLVDQKIDPKSRDT